MTLGADSLRRPSPKSHFESACRNLFKHASKIRVFTAAVFMKSTTTQYVFVDFPLPLYPYFPSRIKILKIPIIFILLHQVFPCANFHETQN
jgi:hypothetical protein